MSRPSERDPLAARSNGACRFFAGVMRRQLASNFRAVRLARPGLPEVPPDRPLMIYANHPSWWDPAIFIALHPRFFPDRQGYGPIDAAMLERYRFMARLGVFGVRQDDPRGAADFLRQAMRVTDVPDRVLWITAQGRFADVRTRPLGLRPGAAHLMARRPEVLAVPLAMEYTFWSEKRPEALLRFGAPVEARAGEGAVALGPRLEAALTDTADALAALAVARDPGSFETLIGGARGTGGVYGLWQRARAVATGRPYAPDHAPETAPGGRP
ncbi:lysophospholipid acyltransferase family protein [Wenxinia marina]|uniref:1-acyl-sn-glycerol-3-phosphate acyltransferase n=1 Tax=Wenxinia marina DSM 24838 TaxID=1123501 RepID=A0A0D0Q6P4_9RHOB|nr:lysophospholipid acyltransferase family protein [Wenxinia marina]KIQ68112.1 1-acyl-sn-glycerol-3-phosphate acyltransferase [Wenxinia marina DSM 24838]GGL78389.1 acyltransferase [Wenxinia marina]